MKDSKFQSRIYSEVVNSNTNIIINAVAGSGKTTTLEKCVTLIEEGNDIIFLAFNNSIVDELKRRIKRTDVNVSTMHSFCWRALQKAKGFKNVELNPKKAMSHVLPICNKYNIPKKKHPYYFYLFDGMIHLMRMNMSFDKESIIELALHHDYIVNEDEAQMLLDLLKVMDNDDKVFDFTDMIYRVIKDDVKLPKFDFVFVDESQDLSLLQQEVIKRIRKNKGRLISVGDPNQAIYGFAGADVNSYGRLKDMFSNTIELPLSVNYRCGKRIVEAASKLNNQIQPYEKNPDGEVRNGFIDEVYSGDWILCRNLKPLIFTNLYLLSQGKKSYVKGSDIGIGLIALITSTNCHTIKSMLVVYKQRINIERMKLIKRGIKNVDNTEKIDNMNQKFDILNVLSYGLNTIKELKERIKLTFREGGAGIVLSTIHKAKGLENDNIFFLCPELIPSQYATQPWQLIQENNLMYVAITRAKKKFIVINDYKEVVEKYRKQLEQNKEEYEE